MLTERNGISIQLINNRDDYVNKKSNESVILISFEDGSALMAIFEDYFKELDKNKIGKLRYYKHTRLYNYEPNVVLVDFIRWVTCQHGYNLGNYTLAKDTNHEYILNHGHAIFDLQNRHWI